MVFDVIPFVCLLWGSFHGRRWRLYASKFKIPIKCKLSWVNYTIDPFSRTQQKFRVKMWVSQRPHNKWNHKWLNYITFGSVSSRVIPEKWELEPNTIKFDAIVNLEQKNLFLGEEKNVKLFNYSTESRIGFVFLVQAVCIAEFFMTIMKWIFTRTSRLVVPNRLYSTCKNGSSFSMRSSIFRPLSGSARLNVQVEQKICCWLSSFRVNDSPYSACARFL